MINRFKSKLLADVHFAELIKGSLSSFILKVVGMIFGYLGVLWITNYYGAAEFGVYTIGVTLLSIAVLIPKFGMDQSLVRIIGELFTKGEISKLYDVLKKSVLFTIILSITVSLILFLNSDYIAILINKPELNQTIQTISYAIVPMALVAIIAAVMQGMRRTIIYVIITSVLLPFLFFISLVIFSLNSINISALELYIGVTFVVLILALLLFKFVLPNKDKKISSETYDFNKIIQISAPMLLTSSFVLIMSWTDILMLSYYTTAAEVGIYSAALKVAAITSISLMAINSIAAPKFVQFYTNNDMKGLAQIAQQSTKLILFTSLPILILIFIAPEWLMGLFGNEFTAGVAVLLLMGIAQFVNAFSGSVGYIMQMTDNQKTFQNVILVAAVLNIVLNYLLIPKYGINGAAFASMVSMIFWNVTLVLIIKIRMGFYTVYNPFQRVN
jgi:O-antigen/teichoic acid export membrane protein